jgi:hypothetical protein
MTMPEPTKESFEYALFLMCEAIRKWQERIKAEEEEKDTPPSKDEE